MATATARFWFVWATILVGWFAFVRITLDVLALLGVSRPAGYLIGLLCGVVLVGLSLYVVWRHPDRESGERISRGHRVGAWLLSLYLVVVWLLLFTGSPTPFYVGVTLLLLPIAIRCADLAVKHLLRPADGEAADAAVPSLAAVIGRAGPARRAADRRRLSDRLVSRPRCRRHDHARHHGDALLARRDQRRGDPAAGRLRLASRARLDRLQAARGGRRGARPMAEETRGAGRASGPCCRSCAICCSWCS